MKRINGLVVALMMVSAQLWAWTSPVSLPDMGDARIRVVGQNARNYFLNYTNSYSDVSSKSALLEKTDKMAYAFIALRADILALCEVEECDSILGLLCAHMNAIAQENVYTYIKDNTSSTYTKVGFVYRKDKVKPYNSTVSATTQTAYKKRLRIQAFEELATQEHFMLSMNHFKAKVNSDDEGESQRNRNATDLINKLKSLSYDPDVLIMGDLNAYMDEDCITMLIDAGYEEQLIRFNQSAYSYVYQGQRGLIDHAMANSTMAEQITSAQVYHINTSGGYSYKYSDHDACVVGLKLGKNAPSGLDEGTIKAKSRKMIIDGQLYIEYNGRFYDSFGRLIQ